MTEAGAAPAPRDASRSDWRNAVPVFLTGLFFLVLFWKPITTLGADWWSNPDAQHGLLLAPIAVWLAWRRGLVAARRPQRVLGLLIIVGAILLRYLSGLAAELFTMRLSMFMALGGFVVFAFGIRQILRWWLPALLLLLSIPLPAVVLGSLALPLQLEASKLGATLLRWRHVPVLLSGNVIHLPGQSLFVTEACSGLRSLTALIALGLLMGGLFLRTWWGRALILLAAIPVAMFLNGIRIFLTGFLVYFVNPALGEGFMHYSEGWVIFVVAFGILGAIAWVLGRIEGARGAARTAHGSEVQGGNGRGATEAQGARRKAHRAWLWVPAGLIAIGALFTVGIQTQRTMPLREPLAAAIPDTLDGRRGQDVPLSDAEAQVAGMTTYLFRTYSAPAVDSSTPFSLYVGYYAEQMQGRTIHSPKNCLPGAGWEALTSTEATISTTMGPVPVNRYLVQNGKQQALVLYWYQGRGRVAANEYRVKWNLLRDAALRQRSEEALVRIVVPVTAGGQDSAFAVARKVAERVAPALRHALPS